MPGDGPGTTLDASITIVDDSLVEGPIPETIHVELLVAGSSQDNGTVRIIDNDGKYLMLCTNRVGISLCQAHCSKTMYCTIHYHKSLY